MRAGIAGLLLTALLGFGGQLLAVNISPGGTVVPVPGPSTAPTGLYGTGLSAQCQNGSLNASSAACFGSDIAASENSTWNFTDPTSHKTSTGWFSEAVYQATPTSGIDFFIQLQNCTVSNFNASPTFGTAAGCSGTGFDSIASLSVQSFSGSQITGVDFLSPTSDQDFLFNNTRNHVVTSPQYEFLGTTNANSNSGTNSNSNPYDMTLSQSGTTVTFNFGPPPQSVNNTNYSIASNYIAPGQNSAILEIETNATNFDQIGNVGLSNSNGLTFLSGNFVPVGGGLSISGSFEPLTPEPSFYGLMALGLAGLIAFGYRARNASRSSAE